MTPTQQHVDATYERAVELSKEVRDSIAKVQQAFIDSGVEERRYKAFLHPITGAVSIRIPTPGIDPVHMTIHVHFVPPGIFEGVAFPFDRQVTILQGSLAITIEGKTTWYGQGDTYLHPMGVPASCQYNETCITCTVERPGIEIDES